MSKTNFLNIQVGDIVIVFDEYAHDYSEHTLRIDSIEYGEDFITETNPMGMHCYGTDLEEEEWGDDYITQVHEGNFCRFKEVNMKKFKIIIEEHISGTFEVEAEDMEQAMEIAEDKYKMGEFVVESDGYPTAKLMMAEDEETCECTEWEEF